MGKIKKLFNFEKFTNYRTQRNATHKHTKIMKNNYDKINNIMDIFIDKFIKIFYEY